MFGVTYCLHITYRKPIYLSGVLMKALLLSILFLTPVVLFAGDTTFITRLEKPDVCFLKVFDERTGDEKFIWSITKNGRTRYKPAYTINGIEYPQGATLSAQQLNARGLPEIIIEWHFSAEHNYGGDPLEGGTAGGWGYGFIQKDIWDLDADSMLFSATVDFMQVSSEINGEPKSASIDEGDSIAVVEQLRSCEWSYNMVVNADGSITINNLTSKGFEVVTKDDIEESRGESECVPDKEEGSYVLRKRKYVFVKQL